MKTPNLLFKFHPIWWLVVTLLTLLLFAAFGIVIAPPVAIAPPLENGRFENLLPEGLDLAGTLAIAMTSIEATLCP